MLLSAYFTIMEGMPIMSAVNYLKTKILPKRNPLMLALAGLLLLLIMPKSWVILSTVVALVAVAVLPYVLEFIEEIDKDPKSLDWSESK